MSALWQSDSLFVNIVSGVIGLAVLILSSDQAVKRLIGLADYFKLSSTFMGMTVVSLATSIPEISAHLTASVGILSGRLDYEIGSAIVLGANIGSDVVQQTLILGFVVFSAGTLYFRRYFLAKSMLPMIVTTIMCIILGLDRCYSRLDGGPRGRQVRLDRLGGHGPHGVQRPDRPTHHTEGRKDDRHRRIPHRRRDAGSRLCPARAHDGHLWHKEQGTWHLSGYIGGKQHHQPFGGNRRRSLAVDILGAQTSDKLGFALGDLDRYSPLADFVVQEGKTRQVGRILLDRIICLLYHF